MTTVFHPPPPQLGPPAPPFGPPPHPPAASPGRGVVWGTATALACTVMAAVIADVAWTSPTDGPSHTVVVPWAPTQPSADQVASARTTACQLWGRSAQVMDEAANAVAHTPADWNVPATRDALANEARVMLVETAYLRRELPSETPKPIRSGIDDYLAANIEKENATAHRSGTARDAAIDRVNAAEDKVNAACQ